MQWSQLLGHGQQIEWFRTALTAGRMATSFLFVGPDGIGKRTFALCLAKSLLCRQSEPQMLAPCGQCEDCTQVEANTHPDLLQVAKPPEKAFLPIELLIGEREKRMRQGLCHDISLRPYGGRRKIAILDDADSLNVEGANCLLKTLEEPPLDSVLILVGTSLRRQLPTIRSRCQTIVFKPLEPSQLETLLRQTGIAETADAAREIAGWCGGSLTEARLLADPELHEFRASLLAALAAPRMPLSELSKGCGAIIDAAGKDAKARRERMKLLFRMASAFYRAVALGHSPTAGRGATSEHHQDGLLARFVDSAQDHWRSGPKGAVACWQRCLLAIEQVDRNANQSSLLEAWSTDIARLSEC